VSYSKSIIKGMTKAEMILKAVLVPHTRVDAFIESYLKLLPDSDTSEFMKILDMKGVKKTDATVLLEVFRTKSKEKRAEGLAQMSSVLNGIVADSKSPDRQPDSSSSMTTSTAVSGGVTSETDVRSNRMDKLFNKKK
jgi:hypothetical protein